MADLKDLYQDTVLDHYRNPRNYRKLERSSGQADGLNPLCGDKLSVFILIDDGIVKDIGFTGSGCAIFIASASIMTEFLKGKTVAEARATFERFDQMLTDPLESQADPSPMGSLAVFSCVREYPGRVRCATLPWHTMNAAVEGRQGTIATE